MTLKALLNSAANCDRSEGFFHCCIFFSGLNMLVLLHV
jgi:hypothetical protein